MTDPARASAQGGGSPQQPGTLLGNRFRIKEFLRSEGGVQLYRASDAQSGDEVTLRVLTPSGPARALLERELGKAQRLPGHKNLASVVGVVSDGPQLLVAHEWPGGHSLREIIDARTAKGPKETVGPASAYTVLGHAAAGLEHGYAQLAHGGLTPANIWVTGSGRIRVADIGLPVGLPTIAQGGVPAGTPAGIYMAPERARGDQPSPSADVYSLGVILYELIAGVPPKAPLVPPSRLVPGVVPGVDAVVGRALLPNPIGRYATPTEMVQALGQAIGASDPLTPGPITGAGVTTNPRMTGRPFDVAAAAGLSQEEARWLVQKDRLDFGPFSLAQVKQQIEQGVFRGDNIIVDMDSGARQKIVEHPQLGDFSRDSERRLEHARRVQAEHAHEHVERKKSRATLLIIGAAVVVLAVGLGIFLMNREAAKEGALAERVGEGDIDEFLKGVKVDFPSSKRPTVRRAVRSGGGGGKDDDPFSGTTVLGDVSQGGADEILGDRAIQTVMMSNYRKLIPCIMDERRRSPSLNDMDLEFVVLGSGKVSAVKVNGQRGGAFPGCVLGRMQSFNFPKYNGSKTIASWSMSMR